MSGFDLQGIADKVKAKFEKKNPRRAKQLGIGNTLSVLDPDKDFIKMPEWWSKATNTPGIPFGRTVILAGKTDSGKTSACIQAMKAAQQQGVAIIYVETEGKTTEEDFQAWGVDPSQVMVVTATVIEEAFDGLFEMWDTFKDKYPDAPLLVIFDSLGNSVSQRDRDLNIVEQSSQPGGKGKAIRLGLSKMISKRDQDKTAVLLISYTYAMLGSIGVEIAGGEANKFFSSLTYRTNRVGAIKKTVKGELKKVGMEVKWTLVKNHIYKNDPGPETINLVIDKEGMYVKEDYEAKKEKKGKSKKEASSKESLSED